MRKIAANIIYPVTSDPIKNGYLVLNDIGEIVEVVNTGGYLQEIAGLEYYSGVLVPGFVNAHCHLELSHLKDKIEPGKGIDHFISQVPTLRNSSTKEIEEHGRKALQFMWSRGINGLGDIMNGDSTVSVKCNSHIKTHNFVELFNFGNIPEEIIFDEGKNLSGIIESRNLNASITPHSKYAVSSSLLNSLLGISNKEIASVHFLEHNIETKYSDNELVEYLELLGAYEKILLVHNLNLNARLLNKIKHSSIQNKIYFVLCPNSNLYIENKLPDVALFNNTEVNVCLGTDSLASNNQLSVLEEMKTITENFPEIKFNKLLNWATIGGAKSLNMDKTLGSFEKGKVPGVLLLSGFNIKNQQLTQNSSIKRLI